MNFGLLVSQLPHVQESRVHYDAMLALRAREPHKLAVFWQRIKALVSSRPVAACRRGAPPVADCAKIHALPYRTGR